MTTNPQGTRRHVLSLLAAVAAPAPKPPAAVITTARSIHQEEDFKVTPQRIYNALLHSQEFTAVCGGRVAEIQRQVGGAFSLFNGHINGRLLELLPNRRIVQAWRAGDWREGVYSIVRFDLRHIGQNGCRVILDHAGFPSELAEHLAAGWQENYWSGLRRYFTS